MIDQAALAAKSGLQLAAPRDDLDSKKPPAAAGFVT